MCAHSCFGCWSFTARKTQGALLQGMLALSKHPRVPRDMVTIRRTWISLLAREPLPRSGHGRKRKGCSLTQKLEATVAAQVRITRQGQVSVKDKHISAGCLVPRHSRPPRGPGVARTPARGYWQHVLQAWATQWLPPSCPRTSVWQSETHMSGLKREVSMRQAHAEAGPCLFFFLLL